MTIDPSGKSGAVFAATGAWLVSDAASGITARIRDVCGGQLVG